MKKIKSNCKLELALYVLIVISIFMTFKSSDFLSQNIKDYIVETTEYTLDLASIVIGIYVAIVSILATSVIPISEEIAKNEMDKEFKLISGVGLFNNFLLVLYLIFMPEFNDWYHIIYLLLVIVVMASFIKFIIIIFRIFTYNMDAIAKQKDSQTQYENRIVNILEDIREQNDK